ncbi:MAG: ATP-dependent helicase [candidate division Zixibacteria bacterium HGW-Zixibacteria-1]|nr:MAG: ATP-dependent helicase [candidate division Zixibacteria bacterium HGW-Zixibacteria-1]
MKSKSYTAGFGGLGIAPGLLVAIARLKFTEPTPIQSRSIPIGLEGKDLIAVAQTGTGKTLAFGIPMIQRLAQLKGRGLVLLPTRELAIQVDESLLAVGRSHGLRTAVLIGGVPEGKQIRALGKNPRIIIATPGRLVDFLERRILNLSSVKILVLDEADRMLDMGFAPQINKILRSVPGERQTMLFSATIPPEILGLAHQHMKLPINIAVAPSGTVVEKVVQEVFFIEKEAKSRLLEVLLAEYHGSVLVFTRTKHGARKLTRHLRVMGQSVAEIHSDRSLAQRRDALEGFKSGKYRVMIATDIAARGIDVVGIELVVNYDLPTNTQDYVHRIGRTARAGMAGRAISFATFDQRSDIRDIEKLIRTGLSIKQVPALPFDRAPRTLPAFVLEQQRAEKPQKPFGRSLKKKTTTRRRR